MAKRLPQRGEVATDDLRVRTPLRHAFVGRVMRRAASIFASCGT